MWIEQYEVAFNKLPYEFHLHGICDMQIGSTSTSMSTLKRRIKEIIEDPFDSGVVIPGDIEDDDRPSTRIMKNAAFADRQEVLQTMAKDHRRFIDEAIIPLLLPLHTKTKFGIMGVLAGHHWMQLSGVQNSVEYIIMELNRLGNRPDRQVKYFGQMVGYMDMRFRDRQRGGKTGNSMRILGHIQHGEGGGQTKAASIAKLERTAQGFEGDFFIRAHDTQLIATKTPKMIPREHNNGKGEPELIDRTIPYLNLGAFTRGYEISRGTPSYIEQKMMRPTAMGSGLLKFKFRRANRDEDVNNNMICDFRIEI